MVSGAQPDWSSLGIFPEPDKNIMIKSGCHYLGGHIGEGSDNYVTEKVLEWVTSVRKLLPMVRQNPQAAHTDFYRSLQHEWAYLQRVIAMDPENHAALDSIIHPELVLALFDADDVLDEFDRLFTLPVKDAGLGILLPTTE
eukprot:11876607-Ditylum_brightwellii.AAC.2